MAYESAIFIYTMLFFSSLWPAESTEEEEGEGERRIKGGHWYHALNSVIEEEEEEGGRRGGEEAKVSRAIKEEESTECMEEEAAKEAWEWEDLELLWLLEWLGEEEEWGWSPEVLVVPEGRLVVVDCSNNFLDIG